MTKKPNLWLARFAVGVALFATTVVANAQFTPGQILTASQLNSALAAKTTNAAAAITGGTITGLSSPLPVASGGTGATSLVGLIAPSYIAAQAADTVLANATSSSASPTAFAMPSCSASTSALQYTSGTGFTCYSGAATTTGTLAQFAATTSAQLAGVLSDETGSGVAVFGTSPTIGSATLNTPTISGGTITNAPISGSTGSFTTLAASSTITPSQTAGIVGTTTNNNANAGSVGEYVSAQLVVTSGITLTNAVPTNILSISLSAGDWEVWGSLGFTATAENSYQGYISTVSATIPASNTWPANGSIIFDSVSRPGGAVFAIPSIRLSLASTTTVYLVANIGFSSGTTVGYGLLQARRRR